MQKALVDNPSIPSKTLENQFKMLIFDPILALKQSITPMIIVVDALDECEDENGVLKVIGIISRPFISRFDFSSRVVNTVTSLTSPEILQLNP